MSHIREIDGLRGLAILSVVFYHADFSWLPGGYIGVDIFFVISGFLITKLILEQIKNDSFSVLGFYTRRVIRLIPALFLVLVSSLLLSTVLVPLQYLGPLADSSRHAAFFLSNFYFLFFVDYFSPSADFRVLGHTWSLAVEEQFYLLYPLLILLVLRVFKIRLWVSLLVLAVISLSLQLFLMYFQESITLKNSAFYLLPSRAWEILAGAILALFLNEKTCKRSLEGGSFFHGFWRGVSPFAGLFCIFLPLFLARESHVFYQVIAVLGCVMLIATSGHRNFVSQMLGSSTLGFVGLISYCLYLWHQPVFAIYRFTFVDDSPNSAIALLLIALSIVLSVLTFYLLESPVRRTYRDSRLAALCLLFTFFATIWILTEVIKQKTSGYEQLLANELSNSEAVYFDHVDDRKFMVSWLKKIAFSADSVVMGSSRIMNLGASPAAGEVVNSSVKGASIEDLVAISPLAVSQSDARKVFMGIDPWMLNKNDRQSRWKSIAEQFEISSDAISSGSEVQFSVNKDIEQTKGHFRGADSGASRDGTEARNKRIKNGQFIVSSGSQQPSERFGIHQAKGAYDYAFGDFEWSPEKMNQLSLLSEYFNGREVEVIWALSPYHPVVSQYSESFDSDLLKLIERRIRREADGKSVRILGSYNSELIGCDAGEFYDVSHPHSSCIEKALRVQVEDMVLKDH